MCPHLSWLFLVEVLPVSLLKCVIQPIATQFLKKWSRFARSANPSLLLLSRHRGGLGLPPLTVLYKKQQVSLQAQLLSSRDHAVRGVAQQQLQTQRSMVRQTFKHAEIAQSVLDQNPPLNQKVLVKSARALLATEEEEVLSESLSTLTQQGRMVRQFEGGEAALWATCVRALPPEPLRHFKCHHRVPADQCKPPQVGQATISLLPTLPWLSISLPHPQ